MFINLSYFVTLAILQINIYVTINTNLQSLSGVGDPIIYAGQQDYQFLPIPTYQNILLSKLTYYDPQPDTRNYLKVNPYISHYNHEGYRPLAYGNSLYSSYFRPHNSEYLDLSGLHLNSDTPRPFYASHFHPQLTPQHLEHFSPSQTSRPYRHFTINGLVRKFNRFYNLVARMNRNLNNIVDGPVTVLVQSKEDPTKLVAILVDLGLQTLGKCSSLYKKV
jgi:hypothetical protein